jgi:hypothetical protein
MTILVPLRIAPSNSALVDGADLTLRLPLPVSTVTTLGSAAALGYQRRRRPESLRVWVLTRMDALTSD